MAVRDRQYTNEIVALFSSCRGSRTLFFSPRRFWLMRFYGNFFFLIFVLVSSLAMMIPILVEYSKTPEPTDLSVCSDLTTWLKAVLLCYALFGGMGLILFSCTLCAFCGSDDFKDIIPIGFVLFGEGRYSSLFLISN
jgi:hypothetical protein